MYVPDLTFPGALDAVQAFSGLAVASGVEHIRRPLGTGRGAGRAAERVVAAAGAAWTIVRSSWFAQNFSEGHLVGAVRSGELALPAGAVAEPFVDAEDIADVAVAALTEPGHDGTCYEVTGPELLTFEDAASASDARPVEGSATSRSRPAEFVAGASAAGVPEYLAEGLAELFATVLDGRNAHVGDGVQRALGRPPRRFDEFCATRGVCRHLVRSDQCGRLLMSATLSALTLVTALGAGISGGVSFAFSTFVMPALGKLPPVEGISAMQSINLEAPKPWLMTVLFGTALTGIVVVGRTVASWAQPGSGYRLLGGLSALIAADPDDRRPRPPQRRPRCCRPKRLRWCQRVWTGYVRSWTAWNHLRTIGSITAAALLVAAETVAAQAG